MSQTPFEVVLELMLAQLIPGHEAVGHIVDMGKNVKDFKLGDRVVADVGREFQQSRSW